MTPDEIFAADLDSIYAQLEPAWPGLTGARIFMTGGTGFIGRWMLEALAQANRRLELGVSIVIMTRNAEQARRRLPHLAADPTFEFRQGDVLALPAPDGAYSHVIHAATDASADLNENDPIKMFDTVVEGTRQALDFARACGAGRFFYLSSGAVYGAQPPDVSHVDETYTGGPNLFTHRSAYAEGKRNAEMLCTIYARQFGMKIVKARIFALLGPLLTLDIHFAAGNFIRDAMAGKVITVNGDGRAVRSYLYTSDLVVWLWTMLIAARDAATYNVGSEEAISIGELAEKTAGLIGDGRFEILGKADPGWNPGRYVPSNALICKDLGVAPRVSLDDAIRRTARWNRWNG